MATVLGGGISGLSAAYYFLQRFRQPVVIYEASNRIGGWIKSEFHRDKGFIFESGPRTIRPKGDSGENTLSLIQDLDLKVEPIPSGHVAARNRLIYAKGRLCPLPSSVGELFKVIPPFSKPLISTLFHDLTAGRKNVKGGDETIYNFALRRFGPEIAEYLVSPLICGICAGNAKEISVRFVFNDLFEKEQHWGSVVKGFVMAKMFGGIKKKDLKTPGVFATSKPMLFDKAQREKWSMYRISDGLETFPRKLHSFLCENDVDFQLSSECRKITFTQDGVKLFIKDKEITSSYVLSALPSYKLAPCVKEQHPSLAALLLTIPYVDVAVVNLQYNTKNLLKMKAFGFLVPPVERKPILGITFDSCCFNMNSNTVLTVMMGGSWFEEIFGKNPSQKEVLDIALQQVNEILGIQQEPQMSRVHVLRKCIPQYTVGHNERVRTIRNYIDNYKLPISLCGAAYDGVGINDVILSARKQVEELAASQVE